jgi:vancomycin resistance protein YoaR
MHVVALLVLLLLASVGGAIVFEQVFAARIYPHVSIHGVPVGTMTYDKATDAVYEHYAGFIHSPVTLRYGTQTWTPSLQDLGMHLDIEDAVQQALATGRYPTREDTLRAALSISMQGLEVPLRLTVDQGVLQRYLAVHLAAVEQLALDAQLRMDGVYPVVDASAAGRQVLVDATMHDILGSVQTLEPQTIAVRTRTLDPVLNDIATAEARQTIETLLQGPIILQARGGTWEWSPHQLADLIRIERTTSTDGPGDRLAVSIDTDLIREWLRPIVRDTQDGGIYPRVNWSGGSLTIIRAGVSGSQVDAEAATQQIADALWTSERTVALPFEDVPVPSTSAELAQLGINELISVGRTSFEDSEDYRVTNIIAGMRLLHGVLVAPDEEFSFNETIGSIGPENGFVEGYAIVDEETQLEWGGGICQDSTTLLRAAFWAGLPLTERWNHSRHISWYDEFGYGPYGNGPGIDATIFLGGPDLKFVNDTGNWILIQAYANPHSEIAEVRMYGTRGGRTVEFAGPRITQLPNGGMDVAFTRIIKQDGVEVKRRTYWSTFDPW